MMEWNKVKELKATTKTLGISGYSKMCKANLILALRAIELGYNINLLQHEFITLRRGEPIQNPQTRDFFHKMHKEIEFSAIPKQNPLTIDFLWGMREKFIEDDHHDMIFNSRLGIRSEQRQLLILREGYNQLKKHSTCTR